MADRDLKVILKTFADVSGLSKIGRGLKRLNVAQRSASLGAKGIGFAYGAAQRIGSTALRALGKQLRIIRNTAIAATAALAGTVREGVKFNVPLAQAVNMFSGNKLKNFVKFRKELLDISSAYGIARSQLSKALYMAGSAEMAPDEALNAVRVAIKGTIADGASMESVMSGMIAGWKAFGGSIDQTAEKLYQIVKGGQTNFQEVGTYIANIAETSRVAGVPLEELGAAFAQITSKGGKFSEAANQMRLIFDGLNETLGEGWSETRTFQEGLEEVARTANYSELALKKIFGESKRFVLPLIGDNFKEASERVKDFQGELNQLSLGAQFVDQFRHWPKIWETIRNFVVEIGSVLDQRWAPRMAFIHDKLNDLRKGKGFKEMVDSIAEKMEKSVTWVVTQIMTAKGLVDHLKDADFGLGKAAQIGATVVQELVTMAVTLLAAQLRALLGLLTGMAKTVAAVFAEDIARLLERIPGVSMESPAMSKMSQMSSTDLADLIKSLGYSDKDAFYKDVEKGDVDYAAVLGFQNIAAVDRAMKETTKDLKAAFNQVADQWDESTKNMENAISKSTGGKFDWSAEAAENRETVESWGPKSSSGQKDREPKADPAKQREAEARLEELRRQRRAGVDAGYEVADYDLARMDVERARSRMPPGNVSEKSFSYKRLQEAMARAEKEREEMTEQLEKAGTTYKGLGKFLASINKEMEEIKGQIASYDA